MHCAVDRLCSCRYDQSRRAAAVDARGDVSHLRQVKGGFQTLIRRGGRITQITETEMAKAPTQQHSVKALPSSSSPMTICWHRSARGRAGVFCTGLCESCVFRFSEIDAFPFRGPGLDALCRWKQPVGEEGHVGLPALVLATAHRSPLNRVTALKPAYLDG